MSASLNQVNLIGNLGRDPEVKYLPGGDAVCNFSIACSETWKDKSTGEKKEAPEWVNIVIYGKLAEVAGQYLKKGSSVYLCGKLKTRKWQDKETGKDRYTTEVVCDQMKMLGGKPDGAGGQGRDNNNGFGQQPAAAQRQAPAAGKPSQNIDDDIPF